MDSLEKLQIMATAWERISPEFALLMLKLLGKSCLENNETFEETVDRWFNLEQKIREE